ncbi:MAG: GNAT family N-acetyltransferase [Bacilli bacterium]
MRHDDICRRIPENRPAAAEDATTIYNLSKISIRSQNLVYRSLEEVLNRIDTYFVYEMDGSIIAFVSLLDIGEGAAELASLHVQPFYQGHDVGTRMVEYVERQAKSADTKIIRLKHKVGSFLFRSLRLRRSFPIRPPAGKN